MSDKPLIEAKLGPTGDRTPQGEQPVPLEEIKPGEAVDLCNRVAAALRLAPGHAFQDSAAWEKLARALAKRFDAVSETKPGDPGTEKMLRTLLDRVYKIFLMSGYRVMEQAPDHNDPLIAWMSDARAVLYGSGPQPDPVRLK